MLIKEKKNYLLEDFTYAINVSIHEWHHSNGHKNNVQERLLFGEAVRLHMLQMSP